MIRRNGQWDSTLLMITAASLAVGFAAWLLLESRFRPARAGLVFGSAALWLAIPTLMGTRLPADFLAPPEDLVDFREGLASDLAIVRKPFGLTLEIDRLWQGAERKNHQIVAAHVPMLLHPKPRRVVVVGMGAGQTALRFAVDGGSPRALPH